jgi:hypothetical protein
MAVEVTSSAIVMALLPSFPFPAIAAPLLALVLLGIPRTHAAEFATPGGPRPANVDEMAERLRQDKYDLELLISFGTSKGGSAGHLALAVRDQSPGDDLVYSANFYADRDPGHEKDFYTGDLMVRIPKKEYLFGTVSSLGPKASFGLDFGEVYKRSVVGVRVYGVPAAQKAALAAFFARINEDYHRRARDAAYHGGEVRYDYMHLNCAKTIGAGFKYGAGYKDLEVKSPKVLPARTRVVAAVHANIPTEMAMKLLKEWAARGYGLDVVLYKKYEGSGYVDPHDEGKVAFKDLPNRFPSVLSLDFRNDAGHYEDYDNLFAMYVLHNMARYSIRVDGAAQRLEIDRTREPMSYAEAAGLAARSAAEDSRSFLRRLPFRPKGNRIDGTVDNSRIYEPTPVPAASDLPVK